MENTEDTKEKVKYLNAAFLLLTSKRGFSLSKLKSGELTYQKMYSWEAVLNAKHVHSVPIIKCFSELGARILNILIILNIFYFKYEKWISWDCGALREEKESKQLWYLKEGENEPWTKDLGTVFVSRKAFHLENRSKQCLSMSPVTGCGLEAVISIKARSTLDKWKGLCFTAAKKW